MSSDQLGLFQVTEAKRPPSMSSDGPVHRAGDSYEPAHARRSDPDTSHAAADSMDPTRLNKLQRKALVALVVCQGQGTNDEIVELSGETWQTITPRMRPLERRGLVRRSGERRARSGKMQTVWEITDAGRRIIA
jgi:DNA-binding MarR family transcriptional regulator